jgi:hypothetical protein
MGATTSDNEPCDMTYREAMFASIALNVLLVGCLTAAVYTSDVKLLQVGKGFR